jgi:hypothetical protein
LIRTISRAAALALVCALAVSGCKKEPVVTSPEPSGFSFTVYPGSRYLSQLTELVKSAHRLGNPNQEPPQTAIFDTDAPVEQVAEYYAKAYGYNTVAPDATNNLSVTKPPAYYRTGDLAIDVKAAAPVIQKLHLKTDASKAQGKYKAAELEGKQNRPRVTLQRPYFDVTTSQVVDRTMILMAR